MKRLSGQQLMACFLIVGGLSANSSASADGIAVVQLLREGGCGGLVPTARALHPASQLNRAAQRWAAGEAPATAVKASGYAAAALASLRISGPDSSNLEDLRQSNCRLLSDRTLRDIGSYQRGAFTWLLLASRYVASIPAPVDRMTARAVELVNAARASGVRCGERSFGPAPPVKRSEVLDSVALGHAADMAKQGYFEHEDPMGRTPADRVRAVGYQEKLVGENIAYGPTSTEEVVQGWLDSPDHCENIMDPRFAEMGIAYAVAATGKHGTYWVQLLVAPRA